MRDMLTIYRRHSATCKHAHKGRYWKRCKCPIWLQDGETKRSLKTRHWEEAEARIRRFKRELGQITSPALAEAIDEFLDAKGRERIQQGTLRKYERLLRTRDGGRNLLAWARKHGMLKLESVNDIAVLRKFVATWTLAPRTHRAEIERLRGFFAYFVDGEVLSTNAAKRLKPPREPVSHREPFTAAEMERILDACDRFGDVPERGRRVKALVLLMRWSGLAISDAVGLRKDAIDEQGRVVTHREKNGAYVSVMIPPHVRSALYKFEHASSTHFWWTCEGTLKGAASRFGEMFSDICKRAGVPNGTSHRLRHTFICEALAVGVPIGDVSKIVGHSSVAITEQHYAKWIPERQARLDAEIQRAWQGAEPLEESLEGGLIQ